MMRRVSPTTWHARHRSAFGAPLACQRSTVNALADLALDSQAATAAVMLRIARAFDSDDADEAAFRRLALAVIRPPGLQAASAPLAAEALPSLGGNGSIGSRRRWRSSTATSS